MTSLARWSRPTMLNLQRDVQDLFQEFSMPRSIRREMERLFDDVTSPRPLFREMERLLEEFDAPPMLANRINRLFEGFTGNNPVGMQIRTNTWNPTHPWNTLPTHGAWHRNTFVPTVELTEKDNEYVLKADLPGVREQDVDLRVDDDHMLTISGDRHEEEIKRGRGGYGFEYSERTYGYFTRSVSLPFGIEPSQIQADFRSGVLEIHIPKTEAGRARRIPVSRTEEPRVIPAGNGAETLQTQQNSASRQART